MHTSARTRCFSVGAFLLLFTFGAALLLSFGVSPLAALTIEQTGLVATAKKAGLNEAVGLPEIINIAVSAVLTVIGVVFLIIIVYAGVLWMVSEGEEKKIEKARSMLFYSIFGLIVAVGAYGITKFLFEALLGGTITGTPSP